MAKGTCSVDDCERPVRSHRMCYQHVRRWHEAVAPAQPLPNGWTRAGNGRIIPPVELRFWMQVLGGDAGCWQWTGATDRDGYGVFSHSRGNWFMAHRWSYEQMVGHIPDDLELDHLCRNKRCVNPYHLDPVTSKANNVRRAAAAS